MAVPRRPFSAVEHQRFAEALFALPPSERKTAGAIRKAAAAVPTHTEQGWQAHWLRSEVGRDDIQRRLNRLAREHGQPYVPGFKPAAASAAGGSRASSSMQMGAAQSTLSFARAPPLVAPAPALAPAPATAMARASADTSGSRSSATPSAGSSSSSSVAVVRPHASKMASAATTSAKASTSNVGASTSRGAAHESSDHDDNNDDDDEKSDEDEEGEREDSDEASKYEPRRRNTFNVDDEKLLVSLLLKADERGWTKKFMYERLEATSRKVGRPHTKQSWQTFYSKRHELWDAKVTQLQKAASRREASSSKRVVFTGADDELLVGMLVRQSQRAWSKKDLWARLEQISTAKGSPHSAAEWEKYYDKKPKHWEELAREARRAIEDDEDVNWGQRQSRKAQNGANTSAFREASAAQSSVAQSKSAAATEAPRPPRTVPGPSAPGISAAPSAVASTSAAKTTQPPSADPSTQDEESQTQANGESGSESDGSEDIFTRDQLQRMVDLLADAEIKLADKSTVWAKLATEYPNWPADLWAEHYREHLSIYLPVVADRVRERHSRKRKHDRKAERRRSRLSELFALDDRSTRSPSVQVSEHTPAVPPQPAARGGRNDYGAQTMNDEVARALAALPPQIKEAAWRILTRGNVDLAELGVALAFQPKQQQQQRRERSPSVTITHVPESSLSGITSQLQATTSSDVNALASSLASAANVLMPSGEAVAGDAAAETTTSQTSVQGLSTVNEQAGEVVNNSALPTQSARAPVVLQEGAHARDDPQVQPAASAAPAPQTSAIQQAGAEAPAALTRQEMDEDDLQIEALLLAQVRPASQDAQSQAAQSAPAPQAMVLDEQAREAPQDEDDDVEMVTAPAPAPAGPPALVEGATVPAHADVAVPRAPSSAPMAVEAQEPIEVSLAPPQHAAPIVNEAEAASAATTSSQAPVPTLADAVAETEAPAFVLPPADPQLLALALGQSESPPAELDPTLLPALVSKQRFATESWLGALEALGRTEGEASMARRPSATSGGGPRFSAPAAVETSAAGSSSRVAAPNGISSIAEASSSRAKTLEEKRREAAARKRGVQGRLSDPPVAGFGAVAPRMPVNVATEPLPGAQTGTSASADGAQPGYAQESVDVYQTAPTAPQESLPPVTQQTSTSATHIVAVRERSRQSQSPQPQLELPGGVVDAQDGVLYNNTTKVSINGTIYDVVEGELQLAASDSGDSKVDSNGKLLGGRKYRVPVFRMETHPNKDMLFLPASDITRIVLGRGETSGKLFVKYPALLRLDIDEDAKKSVRWCSTYGDSNSSGLRNTSRIVTARNAFKVFGAAIVQRDSGASGIRVVDDYYEDGSSTRVPPPQAPQTTAQLYAAPSRPAALPHEPASIPAADTSVAPLSQQQPMHTQMPAENPQDAAVGGSGAARATAATESEVEVVQESADDAIVEDPNDHVASAEPEAAKALQELADPGEEDDDELSSDDPIVDSSASDDDSSASDDDSSGEKSSAIVAGDEVDGQVDELSEDELEDDLEQQTPSATDIAAPVEGAEAPATTVEGEVSMGSEGDVFADAADGDGEREAVAGHATMAAATGESAPAQPSRLETASQWQEAWETAVPSSPALVPETQAPPLRERSSPQAASLESSPAPGTSAQPPPQVQEEAPRPHRGDPRRAQPSYWDQDDPWDSAELTSQVATAKMPTPAPQLVEVAEQIEQRETAPAVVHRPPSQVVATAPARVQPIAAPKTVNKVATQKVSILWDDDDVWDSRALPPSQPRPQSPEEASGTAAAAETQEQPGPGSEPVVHPDADVSRASEAPSVMSGSPAAYPTPPPAAQSSQVSRKRVRDASTEAKLVKRPRTEAVKAEAVKAASQQDGRQSSAVAVSTAASTSPVPTSARVMTVGELRRSMRKWANERGLEYEHAKYMYVHLSMEGNDFASLRNRDKIEKAVRYYTGEYIGQEKTADYERALRISQKYVWSPLQDAAVLRNSDVREIARLRGTRAIAARSTYLRDLGINTPQDLKIMWPFEDQEHVKQS